MSDLDLLHPSPSPAVLVAEAEALPPPLATARVAATEVATEVSTRVAADVDTPHTEAAAKELRELQAARAAREGDAIIIYENHNKMGAVVLRKGGAHVNQYGRFPHDEMIGKPYGTKLFPKGRGKGYLLLLRATPELWTCSLAQRTQILYRSDISMILLGLNLGPGSVVVESGTGSGSLSTSILHAVAPLGHLYTFEFNKERVLKARIDFKNNKIGHLATVRHRDVCAKGFPKIQGGVDAVFLDLPNPWDVVASADGILRPQGRLCSFSPCIEQVQKSCAALQRLGFTDIRTFECLQKTHEILRHTYPSCPDWVLPPNYGTDASNAFSAPTLPAASSITDASAAVPSTSSPATPATDTSTDTSPAPVEGEPEEPAAKRAKVDASDSPSLPAAPAGGSGGGGGVNPVKQVLTRPFIKMRGHTGYLTFAVSQSALTRE